MAPETIFKLPDLGEGLHEAEVVEWHVTLGDEIQEDQPLVAVETDKAVVEVPAPRAGKIAERFGEVGDIVQVGAPLVIFEGAVPDAGTVVGELPVSERRIDDAVSEDIGKAKAIPRAAPAIRALARRQGVDLAQVTPSGPGGAVTRVDIERIAATLVDAAAVEPLRGVRRAMVASMTRAHQEVAPRICDAASSA